MISHYILIGHCKISLQYIMLRSALGGRQKEKQLSKEEVEEAYQKLKKIKYPVRPISNAMYTKKKVNSFSQNIQKKLEKQVDEHLNAYRQVRGDGNCFFRAFAFSYIVNKQTVRFSQIFSFLDQITLDRCKASSIPKQFRSFYNHKLLKSVLKQHWEEDYQFFVRQYKYNYKRALSRMLNENHYFDFIIILYFRSVCLYAFERKKEEFKQFLKGTEEDEITTYGEESEGLILNLCSKFLQMDIHIFEVRKDEVVTYNYKNAKSYSSSRESDIYLLFYDNHYDIFEKHENPSLEYDDEKMEEDYYSEINNTFIPGNCIECNAMTEISEETGLCLDCFNKSMENFNSFQKDTKITGFCAQCQRKSSRISQQLLICDDCLTKMQYSSISNKNSRVSERGSFPKEQEVNSSIFSLKDKCHKCNLMKPQAQVNQFGICLDCRMQAQSSKISNKPYQDPINSSKLSKQESVHQSNLSDASSMQFSSLKDKIQSRIGRQKRLKQQQEHAQFKDVTSAKIFEKAKPIQHCTKCPQKLKPQEIKEGNQVCQSCIKRSKLQSSGLNRGKYNCIVCTKQFQKFQLKDGYCTPCKNKSLRP